MGEVDGSNVRCMGCGYDLAGIGEGGVCPECGEAAAVSVRPEGTLALVDSARLGRAADGLWMLRMSAAAALVSGLVMLAMPGHHPGTGWRVDFVEGLALAAFVCSLAVNSVGAWFLGSGAIGGGVAGSFRAVRVCGAMYAFAVGGWIGIQWAGFGLADLGMRVGVVLAMVAMYAGAAHLLSLSFVLEAIGRRTEGGRAMSEARARRFRRDVLLVMGICVAGSLFAAWAERISDVEQAGLYGIAMVQVALACLWWEFHRVERGVRAARRSGEGQRMQRALDGGRSVSRE